MWMANDEALRRAEPVGCKSWLGPGFPSPRLGSQEKMGPVGLWKASDIAEVRAKDMSKSKTNANVLCSQTFCLGSLVLKHPLIFARQCPTHSEAPFGGA